jgi:hypothetical protein
MDHYNGRDGWKMTTDKDKMAAAVARTRKSSNFSQLQHQNEKITLTLVFTYCTTLRPYIHAGFRKKATFFENMNLLIVL